MAIGLKVVADWGRLARMMNPADVRGIMEGSARGLVIDLARALPQASPQHWSTGAKTWLPEVKTDGDQVTASIRSAVGYLQFPMLGFKAHDIVPRFKRALAWRAGGPVSAFRATAATLNKGMSFATRVHHPGFGGYHFAARVIAGSVSRAMRIMAGRVQEVLGGTSEKPA